MTSLNSLRTLARQQYRFDPNGRVFSDSELDTYINQAYKTVQREMWLLLEDKQVITTAWGTQEYSLPANLYHINKVICNDTELVQTNFFDTDTTQGTPTLFYIKETATGTKIGLQATPNATFTLDIFYQGYRNDIDGTTDSSIPTEYDLLVALYTAYLAEYTLRGNTSNAVAKIQAYNAEKARLGKGRYKTNLTFYTKR